MSWSGENKSGAGTLTANSGITISGTDGKSIFGGRVDNPAHQTTVINGTGLILMINGGTFTNEGTVDDQVDLTFLVPNILPCTTSGGSFNNSGTFTKSGDTGTTLFTTQGSCGPLSFNNTGTVNVNSGTLSLQDGKSTSGSFTVPAGSTLNFSGGTYTLDGSSSVTGAGTGRFGLAAVTFATGAAYTTSSTTVSGNVAGGSVTFNSSASTGTYTQSGGTLEIATGTFSISNSLTWSGGTLGGGGNLVVSGAMSWSGGTKSGAGTLTANSGITISGTDGKSIFGGTRRRSRSSDDCDQRHWPHPHDQWWHLHQRGHR